MHCYCECFVDRLVRIVWNLNPIAELKQYCNMYSHGKAKLFKIYQSIGPIIDRPKRRPRRDTMLNQQQLLALACRYQLVSLDRCGASDTDKSIILLYATNTLRKAFCDTSVDRKKYKNNVHSARDRTPCLIATDRNYKDVSRKRPRYWKFENKAYEHTWTWVTSNSYAIERTLPVVRNLHVVRN